ncbi:S26 family signal peptidase [Streptomyces syringium]|uniref:S26 family signal peptidase n=1 Tax=Streptomyces syringium TaxID=76729 RepID=UPI0033CEDA12
MTNGPVPDPREGRTLPPAAPLAPPHPAPSARHTTPGRRAPFVRVATPLLALLTAGTAALLRAGTGPWAVLCGAATVTTGLGLLLSAAATRGFVTVTVRGASMAPAYRDGDRVLVRRGNRLPVVGQVVVAERPAKDGTWAAPPLRPTATAAEVHGRQWLIKRVAAVAGDPVPSAALPGARVPEGGLVLLGDNRAVSFDSRDVGYFPTDRVLGTVRRRRPACGGGRPAGASSSAGRAGGG